MDNFIVVQRDNADFELIVHGPDEAVIKIPYDEACFLVAALQRHLDELHAEMRADVDNENESLRIAENAQMNDRESRYELEYDDKYPFDKY